MNSKKIEKEKETETERREVGIKLQWKQHSTPTCLELTWRNDHDEEKQQRILKIGEAGCKF